MEPALGTHNDGKGFQIQYKAIKVTLVTCDTAKGEDGTANC